MLKKLLSVVAAAALFALPAFAVELRPDHPETYTVRRGDTLWDISAKFLKSPWNWPEIWQANPQVENPHLIYPGDVLSLIYIDGKAMLVPTNGPRVRRELSDESIKPIPLSAIRQFLDRPRMLSESEWKAAPYVVGLEENRKLGMNTQLAYVRQLGNAAPGTKFAIARPTVVYRDSPLRHPFDKEQRKRTVKAWSTEQSVTVGGGLNYLWKDWLVDENSTVLGYEALEVGTAELVSVGDPATTYVRYVEEEIRPGDLLLPVLDKQFDFEYMPHAPKAVPNGMQVLAFTDAIFAAGTSQVVVLSRGSSDGVENGQTYAIFAPGDKIRDTVKYGRAGSDLRLALKSAKAYVDLPEEFVGHVMIFRTFDGVSYGLMMDGIRPVHLGDPLRMPLN
jgi:hypothetical protein